MKSRKIIPLEWGHGNRVRVFMNPCEEQVRNLYAKSTQNCVRIATRNGDVYMWSGYDAIHGQVMSMLGLPEQDMDDLRTYYLKVCLERIGVVE